jgi:8-oxo-dGTP diphosphatase
VTAREYPARPIVGVGAVVLVTPSDADIAGVSLTGPSGVVLIRRRLEPQAGHWSLPGGVLEVGETLVAGVAREVTEETGLAVHVGPVVDVIDRIIYDPDRRVRFHFVLVDYLCRVAGGQLKAGSDADRVTLADPASLERFALPEDTRRVIARGLELARTLQPDGH